MKIRILISVIIVFISIVPIFSQNLIKNGSFDQGDSGTDNMAIAFDKDIDYWEGRYWDGEIIKWHSPDWDWDNYNLQIRGYELVQQKIDEVKTDKIHKISFDMSWANYSNVNFVLYLSKSKLKYRKEKLWPFQNEENHICSDDYKTFRGDNNDDYYKVLEISDLPIPEPHTSHFMFHIEKEFEIPDVEGLYWIGFQLVDNISTYASYNSCIGDKLYIYNISITEQDRCNTSDPLQPHRWSNKRKLS